MSAIRFTLYSRSYCHLCEDMLLALEVFRPAHDFSIEVIDIDADAVLLEQYDEIGAGIGRAEVQRTGAAALSLLSGCAGRAAVLACG